MKSAILCATAAALIGLATPLEAQGVAFVAPNGALIKKCAKDIGGGVLADCVVVTGADGTEKGTSDRPNWIAAADGAIAALGGTGDPPAQTSDATPTTLMAQMKRLTGQMGALITAVGRLMQAGGAVSVSNFPATQAVSAANTDAALAQLHQDMMAAIPAGTNTIGKVLIDPDANLAKVASYTKPGTSFTSVTIGTTFTAGLGVIAACTAAGNITFQAADGSQVTVPTQVGFNFFGFGVVKAVSQTSTCTLTNLS